MTSVDQRGQLPIDAGRPTPYGPGVEATSTELRYRLLMQLAYGARTATGPYRELNEDAVLAAAPMFAVADGMGGHAAGEVAAAIAIDALARLAGRADVQSDDLVAAVVAANQAILPAGAADPASNGLGTTLAGLCLATLGGAPHWIVVNVGDSRVYRYAAGEFHQVTVDHSEVAELMAAGRLSPEEALRHPLRNVVTRSLGTDPAPSADVWVMPMEVGERFLICSDGLPLEVPDDVIASILASGLSPQETADRLVELALEAGGHDNVSVVVVEVPAGTVNTAVDEATAPRTRPR